MNTLEALAHEPLNTPLPDTSLKRMLTLGRSSYPTSLRAGLLCSALLGFLGGCSEATDPEGATGGEWVLVGEALVGGEEFGAFGTAISLNADGTVLAASAQGKFKHGLIRIYGLENGEWAQLGADLTEEESGTLLGSSLALNSSGDMLAAGLTGKNFDTGAARIYRREGDAWVQVGADLDGQAESERFGTAVAMSADGKTVAIGIPGRGPGGAVETYSLEGDAWTLVGAALPGEALNSFGLSVAINDSGDSVLVGSHINGSNGAGQAQMFKFVSGAWSEVGASIAGDDGGDKFGRSVAMNADGTRILVGAPGNDFIGGLGRILSLEENTWTSISDFTGNNGDKLGRAVSMNASGDNVLLGGEQIARVYQKQGDTWGQRGADLISTETFDSFGGDVAMSDDGDTIVIAAQHYDSPSSFGVGRVLTFQWSQ
ncbi:MAG: FG-GAP repeat protein [Nannocystaceae bacterium]